MSDHPILVLNAGSSSLKLSLYDGETVLCRGLADRITITVRDEGPGLDAERIAYLQQHEAPAAPRPGDGGLGLWIVRRLVGEVNGSVAVDRPETGGTSITITISSVEPGDIRNVA